MRGFAPSALIALAIAGACAPAPRVAPAPPAPEPAAPPSDPGPAAASPPAVGPPSPLKVLVTGFNDWKDLGTPPNVWRCRDNPSCRLVVGDPQSDEPSSHDGPLVRQLRERILGTEIEFTFATMPVTWGAFDELSAHGHDVIVNLGLGVYDNTHTLMVERGAYNLRRGKDAAGTPKDERIDPAVGTTLVPPAQTAILDKLARLDRQTIEGFDIEVADARPANSYLCNETHFRALRALEDSRRAGERLREVYFVHIPYAEDGDYDALARAVAGVIERLVGVAAPG